jgi:hypothetical protein
MPGDLLRQRLKIRQQDRITTFVPWPRSENQVYSLGPGFCDGRLVMVGVRGMGSGQDLCFFSQLARPRASYSLALHDSGM